MVAVSVLSTDTEVRRLGITNLDSLRLIPVVHRPKYKGSFSMECRERGSHGRGVYPTRTQDTSRMGTARVKQEEEADTRIIVIE